jgi:hypothetical protein
MTILFVGRDGYFSVGITAHEQLQQQQRIPFGDDNKKGNSSCNCNCKHNCNSNSRSPSGMTTRKATAAATA